MSIPARKKLIAVVAVACILCGSRVEAECHISQSSVVMCRDPRLAAAAYREFGRDTKAMNASYNKARLHEANCFVVTDARGVWSFKQMAVGRVATRGGWVDVTQINRPHDGRDDIRYVAVDYLRGTCAKQD